MSIGVKRCASNVHAHHVAVGIDFDIPSERRLPALAGADKQAEVSICELFAIERLFAQTQSKGPVPSDRSSAIESQQVPHRVPRGRQESPPGANAGGALDAHIFEPVGETSTKSYNGRRYNRGGPASSDMIRVAGVWLQAQY